MTAPKSLRRAEPKRDRWGRYLLPVPGSAKPVAHTRVTTLVKAIDDTSNLEKWACRMTAIGLSERQDLRALVAASKDDKNALNRIVDQAKEAARSGAGANIGTALHSMCEQLDAGLETEFGEFAADIEAYRSTLAANGVEILPDWMETIVRVPGLGVAGTFDRIVRVNGKTYVVDLKTGSIDYGFTAIPAQLACYSRGQAWTGSYDLAEDCYIDLPDVDQERGLIIHLPANQATCTLHWVDLLAGWEFAQLCHQVREVRKRKDTIAPYTAALPTMPAVAAVPDQTLEERKQWAIGRIKALSPNARESFGLMWPAENGAVAEWLNTHERIDVVTKALDAAEAAVQAPFGASDPTLMVAPEPPAQPEPADDQPDPDGRTITDEEYSALVERVKGSPAIDVLQAWNTQAHEAGHSFSAATRRERQAAILTAALMCAPQGDDTTRTLVEVVIGEELQTTFPTGAVLGTLTTEQARRLLEIARAMALDPNALSFDAEGRPQVTAA